MPDEVDAPCEEPPKAEALRAATTRALETYGQEVFGYLVKVLGSESDAQEVFSQLAEDLWRGLPTFQGRCSMRTWMYVLARRGAAEFRRTPWNQKGRRTDDEQLDALVAHARTQTQPWMRTDVKDRWRSLRDSLDPEDRSLLVLRLDRKLEWKEIARVTLGDSSADPVRLVREANRLKKRLQLLKDDLRRRASEAGLLDDDER
jgi:RNA polymerase sigma-70 factor (ECF subfamily)